jgi:hypothetical protein
VGPLLVWALAARVQLVTMGEAPEIYARFGHAALRVTDRSRDLVYNFGTTNFDRPDLIRAFLRGHVRFWVAVSSFARTVTFYEHEDRSIYVQELRLSDGARERLAARLRELADPTRGAYAYDHFTDNCTTRVRDLIDEAAGGRVRAELTARPFPQTYRSLARMGFPDMVSVQVASDLILGGGIDRPLTAWDASFLPRVLRVALPTVRGPDGEPVAPSPVEIFRRRGPPMATDEPPMTGRALMLALGALLAGLGALARRRPALARTLRVGWALVGGGVGCALAALALYSTVAVLRRNPCLALFWPLDLALVALGPVWRRRYAWVRLPAPWIALALARPPLAVCVLVACGVAAAMAGDLLTPRRA